MTNKELKVFKSRLTIAKRRGPQAVIDECNRALAMFEESGYPDCWSDWERAKDDAKLAIFISKNREDNRFW